MDGLSLSIAVTGAPCLTPALLAAALTTVVPALTLRLLRVRGTDLLDAMTSRDTSALRPRKGPL